VTTTRPTLWEFLVPPSTFGDPDRTYVSATGVRVTTSAGRELLCGTSGLWNVNFGYGHPHITDAIARQLRDASYLGLFRGGSVIAAEAADEIVASCGPATFGRVMFATSGGAANDLLMKVARQVANLRGERSRKLVVGLRGSYHGLTYGALSLTGEELGQDVFAADRRFVRHVDPFDGGDELRQLCEREGDRIAALVLEPVLGTGALQVPPEFIAAAGGLADEYGFLLAADEVATGYHRTGPFRASAAWARQPDLLVLSKGLTNGTCAAAVVVAGLAVCGSYDLNDTPLIHGETQAGTPPTAAAIIATMEVAREFDFAGRPDDVARLLDEGLKKLVANSDVALSLSGVGCFRGVTVHSSAGPHLTGPEVAALVAHTRAAGALVQPGPGGVQLVPALSYGRDDVEELLACLEAGLRSLEKDLH
jgi:adenosylmethionine-8-amino-7-oxononanoate aminotransferase